MCIEIKEDKMQKNLIIIFIIILFMGLVLTFCNPAEEACENWWTVCESQNYEEWPDYESKDEFMDFCHGLLDSQRAETRECYATRSSCQNIYDQCVRGDE